MAGLLRFTGVVDAISGFFGRISAWLVLLACLISAGNATSRYLFSLSSNAWLEIQWQLFAGIFLLGGANVLRLNEHVRVDLLYGSRTPRGKAWTDVIGIIFFLLPAMATMIFFSWEFFLTSFRTGEHSSNAGGTLLWPVKLIMTIGILLMLLQCISSFFKDFAAARGKSIA